MKQEIEVRLKNVNKRMLIRLEWNCLLEFFINKNAFLVQKGFPKTAKIAGIYNDFNMQRLTVIVEDESFPETREGLVFPEFPITIQTLNEKDIIISQTRRE